MLAFKGTRVYWRPSAGTPSAPQQILKNSGYVSIMLQAVQYKANGDLWQRAFGGSDKIAVSTKVSWQNGSDSIQSAAIEDFRKISVPSLNALAIARNVVLKAPASADGIELQVNIHAVKSDNLGKTLQMLKSDEFKKPLELAPVAVGQALAIANLVKQTFTESETDTLQATFPGVIGATSHSDPVSTGRLVQGYIIIIVKQDEGDELDYDPALLTVAGNRVLAGGQPIGNTYMVYNVTFDEWRGTNPSSPWAKKFAEAISKADELIFATAEQRQAIINSARDLLMQSKGLLDADVTYRADEQSNLWKAAVKAVKDRIDQSRPLTETLATEAVMFGLGIDEDADMTVSDYAEALGRAGLSLGFTVDVSGR